MRSLRLIFILSSLLFVMTGYAQKKTDKKYAIEYGTVNSKTSKGTKNFYFIDYGNKSRSESFDTSGTLVVTQIYDGSVLYSIVGNAIDTIGPVRNAYFDSANPEGYKKNQKFKMLPSKTIAEKQCIGFEYYSSVVNEMITIYGWNNIIMFHESGGSKIEAIKFDDAKPSVSFTPQ